MRLRISVLLALLLSLPLFAGAKVAQAQKISLWPDASRAAYIEWLPAPEKPCGACMILIPGGGYIRISDEALVRMWGEELTKLGVQCVKLTYRTPRSEGLPIYQHAWEDGQRAARMVRSEAGKRGFSPEKIGVIGMSAGSHLGLLLATSSLTPAYERIDELDDIPCHINWAVLNAPAYATTDGEAGTVATRQGYGPDVYLSSVFKFDEKTCPISFHHGQEDPCAPTGSTLAYRQLRRMGVPAELHLYPGKKHGAFGFERAVEFMTQMGYLGHLEPGVKIFDRYSSDDDRAMVIRENVWPEGKTPDFREEQCEPYIEWHFPKELKTTAIQIVYSGGGYHNNNPDGFEAAPPRPKN